MKNTQSIFSKLMAPVLLSLILFLGVSCDSFVDLPPPNSQLTGVTVFADNTTATAAMKDIYAKMRDS